MLPIIKKELNSFFTSLSGYLVVGIFLTINGLFLWIFKGDFNIFDNNIAHLKPFFDIAPWIFLFLIPAITMKSFAEEKKSGTLELLRSQPIKKHEIIVAKFIGAFLIVIITLIPTLCYVYTIWKLSIPEGAIDFGSIIGSYIGLLFLIASYTAIGIYVSSCTSNQIIAFITSAFLCFIFYFGCSGFSEINLLSDLEFLSLKYHFNSISRGVIDIRNIIYFKSITLFFLMLTIYKLV